MKFAQKIYKIIIIMMNKKTNIKILTNSPKNNEKNHNKNVQNGNPPRHNQVTSSPCSYWLPHRQQLIGGTLSPAFVCLRGRLFWLLESGGNYSSVNLGH